MASLGMLGIVAMGVMMQGRELVIIVSKWRKEEDRRKGRRGRLLGMRGEG